MIDFDFAAWLESARAFVLPRLVESLGYLLFGAALYGAARWLLGRLQRAVENSRTWMDDLLEPPIRKIVKLAIVFWVLWRLSLTWSMPNAGHFVVAAWIVALTIPIGAFVADLLRVLEQRVVPYTETTLDDTALPLLNRVARFAVVAIGVLIALNELGLDITPLIAGAGVLGLAISLAARDSLSNLVAGVLLILDRPFKVGDRIEIWGAPAESSSWGDVIEIGLRATKIRTPDNLIIVVPNNQIMQRDIINYTASGDSLRLRIPIGIAYDADEEKARQLVLQAASDTEGVLADPPAVVIVRGFGDSAVNLEARVWIADGRARRQVIDDLAARTRRLFNEHGVEIPYPKRDIYIRHATDEPVGPETSTLPDPGDPES